MTERLERITKAMNKARTEKRQTWILHALIDIWDAEALKGFEEQPDIDYGYHDQYDL